MYALRSTSWSILMRLCSLCSIMDDSILCSSQLNNNGTIVFEDVPYGRYGVVVIYYPQPSQSITIVDSVQVETPITLAEVKGTDVNGKTVNASVSSADVALVSDSLADVVTEDMVQAQSLTMCVI